MGARLTSDHPTEGQTSGTSKGSLRLTRGERLAAAACGVVLAVAGVLAVFCSDNELGTAAVLTGGTIFGFIALAGRVPMRAKWGDKEIELADEVVASAARAIEENPDSQIAGELARLLTAIGQATGTSAGASAVGARLTAVDYESRVGEVIATAIPEATVDRTGGPGDFGIDYIVRHGEHAVGVVVKWSASGRPLPTAAIHAAGFAAKNMQSVSAVVLVTNTAVGGSAAAALMRSGVQYVVLDDTDSSALAEVRELFAPMLGLPGDL